MANRANRKSVSLTAAALLAASVLASGCGKQQDVSALLAEAKSAHAKGDRKTAIIQLKNAVQADPESGEARYQLGLVHLDSGDARSAEKEFRKALELNKDAATVQPYLAKSLLLQGEFDKVLQDTDPTPGRVTTADLLAARGTAQLGLGKFADAKTTLQQALLQSPGLPDALIAQARLAAHERDLDSALKLTEQALEKSPRLIDALLLRGDLWRLKGDMEAAVAAYRKAIEAHDDNLVARLNIASVYVTLRKYAEALQEVKAVTKVAPQNVMATYLQALIEFRQQKYAPAKEAVLQVLKQAPNHLPSQMLAGAIEYALGNHAQSEQYLKAVLEKVPDNLYARKLLTISLLRNRQTSRAVETLQPALRQAPEDPAILALAGEVYLQNQEFAKATQYYEKAVKLSPQSAQTRTGLGLSRLASGATDRAMADLEAATDLDADRYQADVMLVMSYLSRNDFDAAEKAVAALAKKQPDNPLTYNLKAAALIGKKKYAEARQPLEKALELSPGYFPAAMNLAQLDLQDNKPAIARKRFETLLDKDSNNLQALISLAGLGSRIGASPQEVLGWLERAKAGNPTSAQPSLLLSRYYLAANEPKRAVEHATEAQRIAPENAEVLDALGLAQLTAGEKNAAVTTFGQLVAMQPKSAIALVRLANAQFANDNVSGATASLKKALDVKPDLIEAQSAMVAVETRAGRFGPALQIAKKVQGQAPKAAVGNILEGDVRYAEKEYAQAATAYEKAYALNRSGALAVKWHAALAQSGKPDEGIRRLNDWLKDSPEDVPVRLYLADAYLKQQKHKGAIEQYEWVIAKQPKNLLVLNNLAWAYQQIKDPRALNIAEKAFNAAPNSAPVIDTYGWMLVEKGEVNKGLDLLQRAVSAAPDQQEIRYHFASALHKAGKNDQARIELERIVTSGIKFEREDEAAALLAQLKK